MRWCSTRRCLFGRRLLDSAVSHTAAAAAAPALAPVPGTDTDYISIAQQVSKHLLNAHAEAFMLAHSNPVTPLTSSCRHCVPTLPCERGICEALNCQLEVLHAVSVSLAHVHKVGSHSQYARPQVGSSMPRRFLAHNVPWPKYLLI